MRALTMFGALALTGCNLIFGLEDAADRPGGGNAAGNGPGGEAPGGGGAGDTSGGGGSAPTAGGGVGGAGGCPAEHPAGPGTELMPNGSFEDGMFQWVNTDLVGFNVVDQDADCGCRAGRVQIGDAYGELRGLLAAPSVEAMVHGRARVRAPDTVSVGMLLRVNFNTVEPAPDFPPDEADGVRDGWRTLEADWLMPVGSSAFLVINVDGTVSPPDSEMLVDCVSLVRED